MADFGMKPVILAYLTYAWLAYCNFMYGHFEVCLLIALLQSSRLHDFAKNNLTKQHLDLQKKNKTLSIYKNLEPAVKKIK